MDGTVVDIGDLGIFFVEHGEGLPVLYVHGNTGSSRWYERAGTPRLHASGTYDAAMQRYTLTLTQHLAPTAYEKRLAEYHRIKNNETGWLTYLWQLRRDHICDAIREDMVLVLEKLSRREKYEEENDFFICKDCHLIFTFPLAMNSDFRCPACEQPMGHFDNEMLLKSLKHRIGSMKKSLGHA